ncbi:hypothetical protein EYF80_026242 [Liparis tanakae]|uniref:Uncharacterized protein n=1 Tax=Liparis tanakae TaxID=230148 RepID=A0A4Z2HDB5_9TELE|nr:hypothetical protein EYF80_026242 [Liparis tanakae]
MMKAVTYGKMSASLSRGSPRTVLQSQRSKSPASTSVSDQVNREVRMVSLLLLQGLTFPFLSRAAETMTVNGTPASPLSTPHSGKSPSPSPTSPGSLSRSQEKREIGVQNEKVSRGPGWMWDKDTRER